MIQICDDRDVGFIDANLDELKVENTSNLNEFDFGKKFICQLLSNYACRVFFLQKSK